MAKHTDPETGVTPAAKDGQPDEDELARRRAQAGNGGNGRSIDDQEPETDEAEDGQLFVVEHGRKISLGNLIPRGVPVEHAFVFAQARRKGAGQLLDFNDDVLLVMRGKVGHVKPVAKRDDQERVKAVTIETLINPKVVYMADSDDAMELLAGVFEQRGIKAA